MRKTTYNSGINRTETRKYIGSWEVFEMKKDAVVDLRRETLHVADDTGRIGLVDTLITDNLSSSVGPIGEALLRFQYSNHIGTAKLEVDEGGNILTYEEYYPFGNTSFRSGSSAAEVSLKRYRFTQKERDEETGFNYHGARYYIPWLCRWCAVDPINSEWYNAEHGQPTRNMERNWLELTASSYEYCYDNPVRFVDPTGEQVPPESKIMVKEENDVRVPSSGQPANVDVQQQGVEETAEEHSQKVFEAFKTKMIEAERLEYSKESLKAAFDVIKQDYQLEQISRFIGEWFAKGPQQSIFETRGFAGDDSKNPLLITSGDLI